MPEPDRAQLKLRDVSAVSAIDAHEHELGPPARPTLPIPARAVATDAHIERRRQATADERSASE